MLLNIILTIFDWYVIVFSKEYYYINHSKLTLIIASIVLPIIMMILCLKRQLPRLNNYFPKNYRIAVYVVCVVSGVLNLYPVIMFLYYQLIETIELFSLKI